MSVMSGIFSRHKTRPAVLRRLYQPVVNGVPGAKTYPITKSVDRAIYYKGSLAKSFISEKFAPDVSGVVLFDPADVEAAEVPATSGRIDIHDETQTGSVNNLAGYALGAVTMAVDGFVGVQPKALDTFFVDGDTVEHEVKAVNYTGSVVTSIAFTPGLGAAVLDNAAITLAPVLARLSVISADDVALQGAVVVVPVKEFV